MSRLTTTKCPECRLPIPRGNQIASLREQLREAKLAAAQLRGENRRLQDELEELYTAPCKDHRGHPHCTSAKCGGLTT